MNSKILFLITVLLLGLPLAGFGLSVETPPDEPAPVKKDKGQRYLESAERLRKDADNLEKRIPKLSETQQKAAQDLVAAKRKLADKKTEASALWKQHLGELPEDFKPNLREAQSKHSALLKEYHRIGRQIKEARKVSSTSTNLIAPASVFGK